MLEWEPTLRDLSVIVRLVVCIITNVTNYPATYLPTRMHTSFIWCIGWLMVIYHLLVSIGIHQISLKVD